MRSYINKILDIITAPFRYYWKTVFIMLFIIFVSFIYIGFTNPYKKIASESQRDWCYITINDIINNKNYGSQYSIFEAVIHHHGIDYPEYNYYGIQSFRDQLDYNVESSLMICKQVAEVHNIEWDYHP